MKITITTKLNNNKLEDMKSSVKSFMATISTILLVAVSCNKEIADTTDPKLEKHTCEMKLIGSLVNYDGPKTRAEATTTTWADGSIIYLRMNSPLGATTGEAIYNASKDVWTISYYGSLYEGVSNSCTALYLEDNVSYENNLFTLDEGTAIYEDLEGSYIYDGGDLIVTANLSPKTGRIRFNGTAGSIIKVYGITHYATYDISTDNYTTSAAPFKLTVGEDGYTPYLYGYFTDADEPNVKLWIDAKEAYTRYCSKDIFNAGQSGKMTIPTEDSHNGWVDGLYFNLSGAQFKMVAVEGGTFDMGNPESTSAYGTVHKVTLSGYCIGETEVTNQLYGKMLKYEGNSNHSSYTNLKPYDGLGRGNAIKYAETIGKALSTELTIPTEAQWEFAARGGNKSKGYKYAGSDNIDEVAWHSGNSNKAAQLVKSKLPNELGIYDMCGNVQEVVLDYYAEYPTSHQVDPCITTGSNGVIRGGNYYNKTWAVYNRGEQDYANYTGFRLALNWK